MLWKFVLLLVLVVNVLGIQIGISKDFKDTDAIISYSGIIRFKSEGFNKGFTNNRVANLLRRAYAEMVTDFQQRRLPANNLPSAMIAFVTEDTEIYFASSMKGGRSIFVQEPTGPDDPLVRFEDIRRILKACQFGTHPRTHNYYGRCGEPSVVELYMSRHGGLVSDENGPIRGRILAWHGPTQSIISPCPDALYEAGRYGCMTFLETQLPRVTRVTSATPDATNEDSLDFLIAQRTWRQFTCAKPEQPPKT